MTIQEFIEKYPSPPPKTISSLIEQWVAEKEVTNFLDVRLGNGVLVADLLLNPEIQNEGISPKVLKGFSNLMGEKAHSVDQVRALLIEKAHRDPAALRGLLNKIQGQLGENQFQHYTGGAAHLADSGSQQAWDLVVHHPHGDQFIQVKVYHDAHKVISEMKQVAAKVAAQKIHYGAQVVKRIDFAVNDDIFEKVKHLAHTQGLDVHVTKIGATRNHIRDILDHAGHRVQHGAVHNLLHDQLNGILVGASLTLAVNAFLLWKVAKSREQAIEDTVYGTAIVSGGMTVIVAAKSAMLSKAHLALATLAGPAGFIGLLGIGMGSRSLLRRFSDRRFVAKRFIADNERLKTLCIPAPKKLG